MQSTREIATTMACLDFLQRQQHIIAYSPNSKPEFSLCNVSTDTTTFTIASFQTMRPRMFQHVNPKVHQPLAKTHATGGGAWVVDMAFPVDSQ